MREIPSITPLRACAAGLVLLSHVAFWTGASSIDGAGRLLARGDAGVAVFFAISAFLLLRPAVSASGPWPPNRYLTKRFARIAPAYWAALLGVFIVAAGMAGGLGGAWKVIEHVLLLQGLGQDPYQGFTQTWSLTTEIMFYLLVPILGQWMRRRMASSECSSAAASSWTTGLVPVVLAVGLAGIVLQAYSASRQASGFGALSTSVLGHAAWFAAGVLVLLMRQDPSAKRQISAGAAIGGAVTTYLLAATPLGGPLGLTHPSVLTAGAKEALYAAFAGFLLYAATAPMSARAAGILGSPLAQTAGEVSYGVFLWHVLVIQVLFVTVGLQLFHAPFLLVLIPTVVVSVALAWMSWTFLERPVLAWAHRRTQGQKSTTR